MAVGLRLFIFASIAALAFYAAQMGRDPAYQLHAAITMIIALGAFLYQFSERRLFAGLLADDVNGYQMNVVRAGVIMTAIWGVVGFLVGVVVASQLAWPDLYIEPWLTFGRLRPLHTSAVIFAFGGTALLTTSMYVVQRTTGARLWGGNLCWFVFLGYQLVILLAATGYVLGATQSKEYAEPVWYIDLWLTIVWVAYLLVYLGTLFNRKEPHIYVANWFYLSFIVTIALLHVVNNLAMPVSLLGSESYSAFSGVQDALTQWWYGHNAVGFFLTAGFLGMMYYFVPKQANRPVYSYRLSIIHFWSLIFLYIWAGPHHLHYTALAGLGADAGHGVLGHAVDALMGRHDQRADDAQRAPGTSCRTDPVIKHDGRSALAFYGMSTFEGPLMSIKAVNSLSHYTDWTIGHVHSGALGWVGMITFGALYYLTPVLWKRETALLPRNW